MSKSVIEVIDLSNGAVVHTVCCHTSTADRVERGMLINMNRERYATRIRSQEQEGTAHD
jgi:hypothetical protein